MPRKGKEKKKKGLSKKEKRALLEAKLEEKRQEEAQLAELRVRVGNLLAYQQPPSAEEYVTQHMKSLRTNPWALVQDVNFAREFLERLKTVLEASCAGPPAGSVSVMALADVAEEKEDELTEDKSDSPANDDEKTKDKADSADKGDDKASAPVPVDLGSAGAAKQQLSPDIQQGLHDISTFVSGQPVFFITDLKSLQLLVDILNTALYEESVFSDVLSILLPTAANPAMPPLVAQSGLINVVMRFFSIHMPEVPDDQSGQPPQQSFAESTFRAVMAMLHRLSAAPELRALIKEDEGRYLHLRALVSGSTHGLSQQQQAHAQRALVFFRHDSEIEASLGRSVDTDSQASRVEQPLPTARVARSNEAMLMYWKGHVHQMFCQGVEKNLQVSARRRMPQNYASVGFVDDSDLESLWHKVEQRNLAAKKLL